jgi:multicomponent Na+:H+ antiporter subunit G
MNSIMGMVLILFGLLINLIGCIGLLRMPDAVSRAQAAVKLIVMGMGIFYLGIFLSVCVGQMGLKALILLFLVSAVLPVSANAIAKAAYKQN